MTVWVAPAKKMEQRFMWINSVLAVCECLSSGMCASYGCMQSRMWESKPIDEMSERGETVSQIPRGTRLAPPAPLWIRLSASVPTRICTCVTSASSSKLIWVCKPWCKLQEKESMRVWLIPLPLKLFLFPSSFLSFSFCLLLSPIVPLTIFALTETAVIGSMCACVLM